MAIQRRISIHETKAPPNGDGIIRRNPMSKVSYTPGQLTKIFGIAEDKGLVSDNTQIALANGTYADFTEAIAYGLHIDRVAFRKFLGLSDQDNYLMKLIAMGKYDEVHPEITPRYFPIVDMPDLKDERLFHFDRGILSEDAAEEMRSEGYRPASTAEKLIYGARNPEHQRSYHIVALGSIHLMNSIRVVTVLYGSAQKRGLGLSLFGNDWPKQYRFLGVKIVL